MPQARAAIPTRLAVNAPTRQFLARAGQSTQPDPIGLAGGLNLYGYAAGDPINFSDPLGLRANLSENRTQAAVLEPCTQEQLDQRWRDVTDTDGAPQCQSPNSAKAVRVGARSAAARAACRRSIAEFGQSLVLDAFQLKTFQWAVSASRAAGRYYRFADWPADVSRATLAGVAIDPPMVGMQLGAAYLSDDPYEIGGRLGAAYRTSRAMPVFGSGLELGEAMFVCLGVGA
jgi:hypothetical protein